jgi:hypothetical protein
MPTVTKGDLSLDLAFFKLGAELSDEDRQCAWELYTEIATRVAVVGKRADPNATDFSGELYSDSLDSLYNFFRECRGIMRKFPVGRIKDPRQLHLGIFINRILTKILRPFLEEWNGDYRHWFNSKMKPEFNPYEVQQAYPKKEAFLKAWSDLRSIMREAETQLAKQYELVPLD